MPDRPYSDDRERIASLETQMSDVRSDIKEVLATLDDIKGLLARATGGLRVILWIGGVVAAIAGAAKSLPTWLHPTGGTH